MNDLGIVSGQMINLSRANTRDAAVRTVGVNGRDEGMAGSLLGGGSIEPQKSKPTKNFTISGGRMATDPNSSGLSANANARNLKYNEEDGFMRGARIAEKIQEFHSNGNQVLPGPGQPVIPIQLNQERPT